MVPPKVFTCPFQSYNAILAVANLLTQIITYGYVIICASKFATPEVECIFEMGK